MQTRDRLFKLSDGSWFGKRDASHVMIDVQSIDSLPMRMIEIERARREAPRHERDCRRALADMTLQLVEERASFFERHVQYLQSGNVHRGVIGFGVEKRRIEHVQLVIHLPCP
jgi:hypothetical protein